MKPPPTQRDGVPMIQAREARPRFTHAMHGLLAVPGRQTNTTEGRRPLSVLHHLTCPIHSHHVCIHVFRKAHASNERTGAAVEQSRVSLGACSWRSSTTNRKSTERTGAAHARVLSVSKVMEMRSRQRRLDQGVEVLVRGFSFFVGRFCVCCC